jgi:hypothetical protein
MIQDFSIAQVSILAITAICLLVWGIIIVSFPEV